MSVFSFFSGQIFMVLKDLFTLLLPPGPPLIFGTCFFVFDKKADFGKRLTRITKPGRDVAHQKKSRVISKTTTTKVAISARRSGGNKKIRRKLEETYHPWRLLKKTNGFLWFVGTHVAKKSLAEKFHPYLFEDLKNLHVSMFFLVERMWKNPGGTWTKIAKPAGLCVGLLICQRVAFVDFSGIVHVDYPGTPSNHGFYWLFQLDDSKSLDEKNGCFTISIHGKKWLFSGVHYIWTLLHGKINPKDWQVLSLSEVGFLLFFRVVSGHYGKPCLGYQDVTM